MFIAAFETVLGGEVCFREGGRVGEGRCGRGVVEVAARDWDRACVTVETAGRLPALADCPDDGVLAALGVNSSSAFSRKSALPPITSRNQRTELTTGAKTEPNRIEIPHPTRCLQIPMIPRTREATNRGT